MAYSTLDDIKKQIAEAELIRLTDEHNIGEIDTAKTDNAIKDADVEVDVYLGKLPSSLPLSPVPGIIEKLSVDLAIRNLYLLNPGGIPEARETQANNAVKLLDKIAKGLLTLGADDPQGDSSDNQVAISSSVRIFSRNSMKGF